MSGKLHKLSSLILSCLLTIGLTACSASVNSSTSILSAFSVSQVPVISRKPISISQTASSSGESISYENYPDYGVAPAGLPPAPQLTEKNYDWENGPTLPPDWKHANAYFESDAIHAAAIFENSKWTVKVSTNEGKDWKSAFITEPDSVVTSIGFSSKSDGWFMIGSKLADGHDVPFRGSLYKTADSGQSWTHISTQDFPTILSNIVFANPQIGWLCADDSGGIPHMYQTYNGGKTWSRVKFIIPDVELLDLEMVKFRSEKPRWEENKWKIKLGFWYKQRGRVVGEYEFTPSPNGEGWEMSFPENSLSDSVNKISFFSYVQYAYLPYKSSANSDFDEEDGLGHDVFMMMRDYLLHANRIQMGGAPNYGCILPAKDINALMGYFYADKNFNAAKLPEYDKEIKGVAEHLVCEHGGINYYIKYYLLRSMSNGDIDVVWERVGYFNDTGLPPSQEEDGYVPTYGHCIFRPVITPDGIQVFTLILSEQVPNPN